MPLDLTPNQPPYYEIVDGPAPSGTKYYTILLQQTSPTGAPTPTILQNTLTGTPTWSRIALGNYRLTSTATDFIDGKTYISGMDMDAGQLLLPLYSGLGAMGYWISIFRLNDNAIDVFLMDTAFALQEWNTIFASNKIAFPKIEIYP